jgi:ABC-type multidrug transport system fused ATPase/permease subunit
LQNQECEILIFELIKFFCFFAYFYFHPYLSFFEASNCHFSSLFHTLFTIQLSLEFDSASFNFLFLPVDSCRAALLSFNRHPRLPWSFQKTKTKNGEMEPCKESYKTYLQVVDQFLRHLVRRALSAGELVLLGHVDELLLRLDLSQGVGVRLCHLRVRVGAAELLLLLLVLVLLLLLLLLLVLLSVALSLLDLLVLLLALLVLLRLQRQRPRRDDVVLAAVALLGGRVRRDGVGGWRRHRRVLVRAGQVLGHALGRAARLVPEVVVHLEDGPVVHLGHRDLEGQRRRPQVQRGVLLGLEGALQPLRY